MQQQQQQQQPATPAKKTKKVRVPRVVNGVEQMVEIEVEEHGLAGSTYAEAQQAFEAASVVGIVDGSTSKLNPPADTVLTADS